MNNVNVTFIHPTNSSELLTVAVPSDATASWLVSQMISSGFITKANPVGEYKLQDTRTGKQLNDDQTLREARIYDGASLQVNHNTSGAAVAVL
jgi:hypothetical protein